MEVGFKQTEIKSRLVVVSALVVVLLVFHNYVLFLVLLQCLLGLTNGYYTTYGM